MLQSLNNTNQNNSKQTSADIIVLSTQREAQDQAYADAATSGARVFNCHLYQQGERTHLTFPLPFNLLLEFGKLNSADGKKNKSNAEESINRPLMTPHVNEITKYLLETENYILPPFIFNSNTPIKVFAFGTGSVQSGYAIIPTNIELYVTDGQHRLKAIEKAIIEKPEIKNDSVTVLVVQEEDIDQIHQDFADCAKNKPIPPAFLAAFDINNILSKITRQLTKESTIFCSRIDKISRTVGKDPAYIFTMSQLQTSVAEFLYGSAKRQVIESRIEQQKGDYKNLLEKVKIFYTEFAQNNETWKMLLQPASATINLDLSLLRQQRVDFNSVGFQIISRIGHLIFFNQDFNETQKNLLIKALASLDYRRTCTLWQNSIVIDDGNGNKKIIAQMAAIDKGFRIARDEVEKLTGMSLR
jgi:DNA sulfur modification protein DndB